MVIDGGTVPFNTNPLLLDAIDKVLDGSAHPETLLQSLQSSQTELEGVRQGFDRTVSRLALTVREENRAVIQEVMNLLSDYAQLLKEAGSCARGSIPGCLPAVRDRLFQLTGRLRAEFLNFKSAVLILLGPTRHGGVNVLINTLKKIIQGDPLFDELEKQVTLQQAVSRRMVEELGARPQTGVSEKLVIFYRDLGDILEKHSPALRAGDRALLGALMTELEKLGEDFQFLDIDYLVKNFSVKPTAVPLANLVMNCADLYHQGKITQDMILFIIKDLMDSILNIHLCLQNISPEYERPQEIEEAIRETFQSLTVLQKSCVSYEQGVSRGSGEPFRTEREAMIEAACSFSHSFNKIRDFVENEDAVSCLSCGTYNSPLAGRCYYCNALMATISSQSVEIVEEEERSGTEEPLMTSNVFRLIDAAEAFLEKVVSRKELLAIIAEMESRLAQAGAALRQSSLPAGREAIGRSDEEKSLKEAQICYGEGLSLFSGGLSLLRDFAENPSGVSLDTAKNVIQEGAAKIQQAQKLLSSFAGQTH